MITVMFVVEEIVTLVVTAVVCVWMRTGPWYQMIGYNASTVGPGTGTYDLVHVDCDTAVSVPVFAACW